MALLNNYWATLRKIIDLSDKSRSLRKQSSIIVLSIDLQVCFSYYQLWMSNQSLTAQGIDLPLSHRSVVSMTHEQTYLWPVTYRSRGVLSANEKEGNKAANDK